MTSANYNVVVGYQSLVENEDGHGNVAVGYLAGEHDNDGADVTSPDNCVIIGYSSRFETTTPDNEIVIGANANGKGDNTATIGDDNITAVYMSEDSGAVVHCSGINFPDTQAASGDANTLDDYEEGVHAVTLGGASFTMSSVKNSLQYTKIGRLVTLSGEISVTAVSSATGTFTISLPFTVADIDDLAERFQGTFSCQNINFSGDYLNIGSYAGQNTMSVQISNSNGAWTYLQASTFSSTSEFVVSVQYIT